MITLAFLMSFIRNLLTTHQWAPIFPSLHLAADIPAEALHVAFHVPHHIQLQVLTWTVSLYSSQAICLCFHCICFPFTFELVMLSLFILQASCCFCLNSFVLEWFIIDVGGGDT